MNTNEPTNDKEMAQPNQPETTQDGELNDEELENVAGGLLPAVKNKVSPVIKTNPDEHGIIAILIGL